MNLEGLSDNDRSVLRSIFDPTATIGDVADDGDSFVEDEAPSSDAHRRSKELCLAAVTLADGNKEEALKIMNQAVEIAPDWAAAYNDRAQLMRLIGKDEEAMSDLEEAIRLTEGKQSRARALALCQRGVLLKRLGREVEARSDFAEAAKLGSTFGRKQIVEMNPYAALCNQMLSQVLKGNKDIQL